MSYELLMSYELHQNGQISDIDVCTACTLHIMAQCIIV